MARRSKGIAAGAAESRSRLDALASVAEQFGDWRPGDQVVRQGEAVPTIFPDYDRQVGGGHPVGRIGLIHGPSGEGKTELLLGLGLSYLRRGHFFGLADAERTTVQSRGWVSSLFGDALSHPGFVALPANSYEQTRAAVRRMCETIADQRDAGVIPEDTTALIGIDSIRKLVPNKLWENLTASISDSPSRRKAGEKKGIDGFSGRAGQIKAALNAAWVDELVPLLANTRCSLVFISRETKDEDDVANFFSTEERVKVGGGAAIVYDSSLRLRVTSSAIEDDDGNLLAERHEIGVFKTKVGERRKKVPIALFHTTVSPAGFDLARDALAVGVQLHTVQSEGGHYRFGDSKLGHGEAKALEKLRADPALLDRIVRAIRSARSA